MRCTLCCPSSFRCLCSRYFLHCDSKSGKGEPRVLFSLLIGTLNRSDCIGYCLESLRKQKYRNFEVVIIDQSDNDLTEKAVQAYQDLAIVYERVHFKGLSRARNEAIRCAKGDYFCLIDDDAYYSEDYLTNIEKHIRQEHQTIVSGYLWDSIAKKDFTNYKDLPEGRKLTPRQVIRYCPSPAVSFPKAVVYESGGFDEEFGVGAKYGAGEETDFILRAMRRGYTVRYYSDVKARHPHEKLAAAAPQMSAEKSSSYNFGIGAMYEKQFLLGNGAAVFPAWIEKIVKSELKCLLHGNDACHKEKAAFWQGKREYNRSHCQKGA